MIYSSSRGVYVSFIQKARRDNSVAKKGQSYIRAKRDKYAKFELFKNIDNLDKKYPRMLNVSELELRKILDDFIVSTNEAKEFLQIYFKI